METYNKNLHKEIIKKGEQTYNIWVENKYSSKKILSLAKDYLQKKDNLDYFFKTDAKIFAYALQKRIDIRYKGFFKKLFKLFSYLKEKAVLKNLQGLIDSIKDQPKKDSLNVSLNKEEKEKLIKDENFKKAMQGKTIRSEGIEQEEVLQEELLQEELEKEIEQKELEQDELEQNETEQTEESQGGAQPDKEELKKEINDTNRESVNNSKPQKENIGQELKDEVEVKKEVDTAKKQNANNGNTQKENIGQDLKEQIVVEGVVLGQKQIEKPQQVKEQVFSPAEKTVNKQNKVDNEKQKINFTNEKVQIEERKIKEQIKQVKKDQQVLDSDITSIMILKQRELQSEQAKKVHIVPILNDNNGERVVVSQNVADDQKTQSPIISHLDNDKTGNAPTQRQEPFKLQERSEQKMPSIQDIENEYRRSINDSFSENDVEGIKKILEQKLQVQIKKEEQAFREKLSVADVNERGEVNNGPANAEGNQAPVLKNPKK